MTSAKVCVWCHTPHPDPVHSFVDNPRGVLRGWYCPSCEKFDPAIGRERQIPMEVKDHAG